MSTMIKFLGKVRGDLRASAISATFF